MDVLFINSTDTPQLRDQTNGTMLLATRLLQGGITAEILCFHQFSHYKKQYEAFISDATEKILAKNARCVSFYTLWPYFHIMLRMAKEIKARSPQTVIVFGGPQATFSARQVLEAFDCIDYICTGEGEELVVSFFRSVLAGERPTIAGLFYREKGQVLCTPGQPPLTDLEQLPYWDDRLLSPDFPGCDPDLPRRSYYMPIDSGRGCPFRCTFCCTNQFLHRSFRLKSADRMIRDIRYHKEHYGIRSFRLSHDAFTTNRKLVLEFCRRLREEALDVNWRCCSRIDLIDEELILNMKAAGMDSIELGLETGSERMQALVNKRLDLARAKEMVAFLLEQKLRVVLFFMYGFPEETPEDLRMTLDLFFELMDMGVQTATMAFCRFYPGTKDTEQYASQLVFDPSVRKLSRHVFGYENELSVIRQNPAIFPFFHHLPTPVRQEFQNLFFLGHLYQRFPRYIRYLRQSWAGDNLQFARDFLAANEALFSMGMEYAYDRIHDDPMQFIENLFSYKQLPGEKQLRAMLTLDLDLSAMSRREEGAYLCKCYDFSMVELKLGIEAAQMSDARTQIALRKRDGKTQMKILGLQTGSE